MAFLSPPRRCGGNPALGVNLTELCKHRSDKLPAQRKDTLGSPAPYTCLLLHLCWNSRVCSVQASWDAVPRELWLHWRGLCLSERGEKTPPSSPPSRPSPANPCFSGAPSLSQLNFPACPAGILCVAPGGPFTLSVRGAQASSKALGRIWWEGEKGFYKLPFRNGHFEVM